MIQLAISENNSGKEVTAKMPKSRSKNVARLHLRNVLRTIMNQSRKVISMRTAEIAINISAMKTVIERLPRDGSRCRVGRMDRGWRKKRPEQAPTTIATGLSAETPMTTKSLKKRTLNTTRSDKWIYKKWNVHIQKAALLSTP